ncbi:MAG: leucine-rich repeat domain-containing protein [Bacteroidota bacterium]
MRQSLLLFFGLSCTHLALGQGNKYTSWAEALSATEQVEWLDLDCPEIQEIPRHISRLPQLQSLYLTGCDLGVLPDGVEAVESLTLLNVQDNRLGTLPPNKWQNLRVINLRNNQLEKFPTTLLGLPHLREVDLSGNTGLDITQTLTSLAQVPRLDFLYLSDLSLTELPAQIKQLQNLEELHLTNNPQLDWSGAFQALAEVPHLTILVLTANELTDLPEATTEMSQLKGLVLDQNPDLVVETLIGRVQEMAGLKVLLLRENELNALPSNLEGLGHLDLLDLSGNQFSAAEQDRIREALPETQVVF